MLIDLHALLSCEGKVKRLETELEMDEFVSRLGSFPISDKKPMSFVFTNVGDGKVMVIPTNEELKIAQETLELVK